MKLWTLSYHAPASVMLLASTLRQSDSSVFKPTTFSNFRCTAITLSACSLAFKHKYINSYTTTVRTCIESWSPNTYRVANQITGGAGCPPCHHGSPPLDMYIILRKCLLGCRICFKVCIYVGVLFNFKANFLHCACIFCFRCYYAAARDSRRHPKHFCPGCSKVAALCARPCRR